MSDLRVAIIGYGLAGRVFHATDRLDAGDDPQQRGHREPDKPIALTAAEAERVIDRAETAGVLLSVFQNRRWDSDQLTLARLLRDGELGNVIRYESRFERWRPAASPEKWRDSRGPEDGGGQLLDLGSHLIDQALFHFGPAAHVYGEVAARRGVSADDDAFIAIWHESGVISHLHASAVTAAPGPRLRVLGTAAAFMISGLDSQEDQLRAGHRPDSTPDWGAEPESAWGQRIAGLDSRPVPSERGDWPSYYAQLADAVRGGQPPPVDPRDALAALRVIEATRRSAASKAVIALR
ncbi:MAG: Gfo/Idh/MocA family oxidoreductase [Solirubrobacteraceae bacterium]